MSEDDEGEADQTVEPTEDAEAAEGETDEPAESPSTEDETDQSGSETTPDDGEAPADEEADGLKPGDFIRLEYTVRTVPDEDEDEGRVVDTTRQEVAEEAGIDDDEVEFEPRIVVLDEGHVFDTVDTELQGKHPGDEGTVQIPAVEAFGEFDPDQVRTVSADKIPEDDRRPGAQVTVDGEQGYLETIIGGRARVDFNHPLAGDDLEYEYEILDRVDDAEAQAAGLLGMYLQAEPTVRIETETVEEEMDVEVHETEEGDIERETETEEVEKTTLYVEATPMMQMNQQWMFQKQQVAQDLIDRLDLDRVVIEEIIEGGAGGMMPGMGGMMGAGGSPMPSEGDVDAGDIVEELEEEGDLDDVDLDADELVEELEDEELEASADE